MKKISAIVLFILLSSCAAKQEPISNPNGWIQGNEQQLFLGFEFGMSRLDMIVNAKELNDRQIIKPGAGAEFLMDDSSMVSLARVAFYPVFNEEDELIAVPMTYGYAGWAPWNEHLSSDSLAYHVSKMLSDSLHIDFDKSSNSNGQPIYTFKKLLPMIKIEPIDDYKISVVYALDNQTLESTKHKY